MRLLTGYRKKKADKHRLDLDPETAPVVREIFDMRLSGMGLADIARNLNDRGILCPTVFLHGKGRPVTRKGNFERMCWLDSVVLTVLQNEIYTGAKARAVFARGIIMKPQIILADGPTASLDVENRERIVALLFRMNEEFNTTIITVTHDLEIANRHDRVIHLERSRKSLYFS